MSLVSYHCSIPRYILKNDPEKNPTTTMFSQTLVVGCEKGPKSFFRVFYKDKTNLGFVNWLVELFVGVFQPLD